MVKLELTIIGMEVLTFLFLSGWRFSGDLYKSTGNSENSIASCRRDHHWSQSQCTLCNAWSWISGFVQGGWFLALTYLCVCGQYQTFKLISVLEKDCCRIFFWIHKICSEGLLFQDLLIFPIYCSVYFIEFIFILNLFPSLDFCFGLTSLY